MEREERGSDPLLSKMGTGHANSRRALEVPAEREASNLGRILTVDGDRGFLDSTTAFLRREGYQCTSASEVRGAAMLLQAADYDLMISAIDMEGNSKLELIRHLPIKDKGMPAILVTRVPSLESAIQSIGLSVAGYLVKPVDSQELLDLVRPSIKNYRFSKLQRRIIRNRMEHLKEDMEGIEGIWNTAPEMEACVSFDAFFTFIFQNIVGGFSDLKHLTEILLDGKCGSEVCHLLDCPRLAAVRQTLQETIDALGKTKSAFKSKGLGEIRNKLETLLKVIR